MTRAPLVTLLAGAPCAIAATQAAAQAPAPEVDSANSFDRALAGVFEAREPDWRDGAVVYQAHLDRLAPSAHLDAKRALYPAPKKLHAWTLAENLPELNLENPAVHDDLHDAHGFVVLKPDVAPSGGYTHYKRVQ